MTQLSRNSVIASACVAASVLGVSFYRAVTIRAQGQVHEISVTGDHYAFSPPTINVRKDELVKVTFTASDMPHSLTIDDYRISKRAGAGQSVVFEFRADRAGEFDYYCDLKQDDRCRGMKGKLIVKP
jgi:heme/copper-type cytochrome/quinol oxidase subunit 2